VQLRRAQDFENDETSTNYNWGYVTSAYNTPEGWYATDINNESRIRVETRLRRCMARHRRDPGRGLQPHGELVVQCASSHYYYRYRPTSALNGSGCGNDFCKSADGPKYILDTLKY
jgi:pullulanase